MQWSAQPSGSPVSLADQQKETLMSRIAIALVAALVLGSASTAFAAPKTWIGPGYYGPCTTGNTACTAPGP